MLERKYGGVKARNAALTIQRAFRRYTLLKKFAAITAMAKAEKRLSRRLHTPHEVCDRYVDSELVIRNNFAGLYQELRQNCSPQSHASTRPLPLRSMSMRERRNVESVPLPRSQSSRCDMAHVNVQLDYYAPKHFWDTTHYYAPQEAFSESGEVSGRYNSSKFCLYAKSVLCSFCLLSIAFVFLVLFCKQQQLFSQYSMFMTLIYSCIEGINCC